jgi:type II restriction enzyme
VRDLEAKGWLVHVMRCIERLGKSYFSLDEVYGFETELSAAYPGNRHVRPKIRQKLQVLRDNGYLDFLGRGNYKLAGTLA